MQNWDASTFKPFFERLERRAEILKIVKPWGIGVELGVAEGHFSSELLGREHLAHLYSIDMYAGDRGHDIEEYKKSLKLLMPFRDKNTIIKMKFDEAAPLFDDEYFDFIYVDGYAHTGEEGGHTFRDWFPKLKKGGVLSGHDYVQEYPLVIQAVDAFVLENSLPLYLINDRSQGWNHGHPTWFTVK
ncbi:class I SAM-dependent methyltransferase [Agrobacterium rosae]|uniref:class I SAM-dependent methyltransferase n=1 Tax=Agrobacterium rosae TaxID=1972867 RepID=UPI003BA1DFD7